MTIAKNEHTVKFDRAHRFLIDDEGSNMMLAYEMTKPYKLGSVYNGKGVFKFVLQEVNTTEDDNLELRVADYYKYFRKETVKDVTSEAVINPEENINELGKQVWL